MFFWTIAFLSTSLQIPAWLLGREDKRFYFLEIFVPLVSALVWAFMEIAVSKEKSPVNLFVEIGVISSLIVAFGYMKLAVQPSRNGVVNRWAFSLFACSSSIIVYLSFKLLLTH